MCDKTYSITESSLEVVKVCHKSCAHYTLGARYLYFKRNAEKFGVRVIRKVRAIGRKIR
jgi:hypothetical protein